MKKLSLPFLFALALISNANAEVKPYAGVAYQLNHIDYKSVSAKSSYDAPSLFAGVAFNDKFSAEVGYSRSLSDKNGYPANLTTKTKISMINLDGIYSHAVTNNVRLLAIASVADIYVATKTDANGTISKNKDRGHGYGLGLGIEAGLTKNVAFRVSAKALKTEGVSNMDYAYIYNAGFKFGF